MAAMMCDGRRAMQDRSHRVRPCAKGDAVEVRITKETDRRAGAANRRDLSQPLGGLVDRGRSATST